MDDEVLNGRLQKALSELGGVEGYARLEADIQNRVAEEKRLRRRGSSEFPRRPGWRMMAAASGTFLLLGALGGYFLAAHQVALQQEKRTFLAAREQAALHQALNQALETLVSGKQITWAGLEGGAVHKISPIRTYQAKNGQWCREYIHSLRIDGQAEKYNAVACRVGKGSWRPRLKLLDESGPV